MARLARRKITPPISREKTPALMPVPSALVQASYAAKRLAQEAARSRRRPDFRGSALVKIRATKRSP
jgi:hypothetical protein